MKHFIWPQVKLSVPDSAGQSLYILFMSVSACRISLHWSVSLLTPQAKEEGRDEEDGAEEGGSGPPSTSQLDQQLSPMQALQRQEQQVSHPQFSVYL